MAHRLRKLNVGFSLIELLVVIAIIAILSALLFPVFERARENARKTSCMSNMHQMFVACHLYKEDNGGFPCMLLGYAEVNTGLPWTDGETQPVVAAGSIQHGYLYPTYVKNIEAFHCPDNLTRDQRAISIGEFTAASPIFKNLQKNQNGHT